MAAGNLAATTTFVAVTARKVDVAISKLAGTTQYNEGSMSIVPVQAFRRTCTRGKQPSADNRDSLQTTRVQREKQNIKFREIVKASEAW